MAKTIELTDEQYEILLDFKNYVSLKTRQITNPEVLKFMVDARDPKVAEKIKKSRGIPTKVWKSVDFEPEYPFGQCIADAIGCIWNEQETGNVNYIT